MFKKNRNIAKELEGVPEVEQPKDVVVCKRCKNEVLRENYQRNLYVLSLIHISRWTAFCR